MAIGLCDLEWETDDSTAIYSTEYISLILQYIGVCVTKKAHPTVSVTDYCTLLYYIACSNA